MSYNTFYMVHTLFILYPKLLLALFMIGSIMFNIYLFYIQSGFYDEYVKFNDRTSVKIQRHLNPLNNHYIDVPLDYKIFDTRHTIFKIVFYVTICILPFLLLRFLRLGTEIDLVNYYNYASSLPLFVTIIMICNAFHLILFFRVFWLFIYGMFYKELKKYYIYLVQYGGCLDVKYSQKDNEPYIFAYFLNPLKNVTYQNLNLFLYNIIDDLQNKNQKNEKFMLFIINFLKQLQLSIPLFYTLGVYILFFLIVVTELYLNNFVLKKVFYILFFLFFYRQFYNLIYFSWYHNVQFDLTLALYYYKLKDLTKNTLYGHSLRLLYASGATYNENERLLYYLNTGLNLSQADAVKNNEEWPIYPKYYRFLINKISTFILWIKKHIYNKILNNYKNFMNKINKLFKKALNDMIQETKDTYNL